MYKTVVTGVVMGVAMLLPSLSIGSVALIFGQYKKLVSIASKILTFFQEDVHLTKKEIYYTATLFTTIFITVLGAAQIISSIIESQPALFETVYVALVLGAVAHLTQQYWTTKKQAVPAILLGFTVFASILFTLDTTQIGVPLTVATFIAGMAMVLPGVSGSFMLYTLQGYEQLIQLLASPLQNIRYLAVIATTILIGAIASIKTIKLLLDKKDNVVILFFTGVLLAGLTTVDVTTYAQEPTLPLLGIGVSILVYYGLRKTQL